MKRNAMRAMVILCVLSSPMGCQLIKRLTNRGQDAGTTTAPPTPITPAVVDADAGAIAVPNPNVVPMPTADVDAAAPAMPAAPDVPAVDVAAPAMPTAAVADAGAPPPPTPEPAQPTPTIAAPAEPTGHRPRGPRNYCKDHPGRVNPATGEVCPMRGN